MIFKAILQYCQTRGEGKNGGGEEAVCTRRRIKALKYCVNEDFQVLLLTGL